MKLKRFYPLAIFVSVAAIATADILSDNGKAGNTGSPGESTCTNCHSSYSLNSGGGSINITASNMPNWEYIPGQVYHLSVTVSRSANSLFGLGFEALKANGNTPSGTFTITSPTKTTIKNATVNGVSRPNVVHKLNGGAGNGSYVFTFDWTAPSSDVGNIVFYAAGNACNNNGNESGDYVYKTSRIITPMNSTGLISSKKETSFMKIYPSPIHEEVTIEYTLESPSQVQISLLSLSGEKIATLINETQFGGNYIEQFNLGSKMKKGLYLLSIETKQKREIKKIVIQ